MSRGRCEGISQKEGAYSTCQFEPLLKTQSLESYQRYGASVAQRHSERLLLTRSYQGGGGEKRIPIGFAETHLLQYALCV